VVTHQLQVERRTGKVRRPETDVLPLCHATNRIDATQQHYTKILASATNRNKALFINTGLRILLLITWGSIFETSRETLQIKNFYRIG